MLSRSRRDGTRSNDVGDCADTCDGRPELLPGVLQTLLIGVAGTLFPQEVTLLALETIDHVRFDRIEALVERRLHLSDLLEHSLLESSEISW